ncbi:MAG: T9SS type A sorting domain-containing protein, partial [Saprospiraceae bacterium]|nr:T9SS type A sorting domain-containing protein [Saprospiraceae bacterium]
MNNKIKFLLIVFILVVYLPNIHTQDGFIKQYSYDTINVLQFYNVIYDGDYLVVYGRTLDVNTLYSGFYVSKVDTFGNVKNEVVVTYPNEDHLISENKYEIIESNDGGYLLVGQLFYKNNGVLVKLDKDLNLVFIKDYSYNTLKYSNVRNMGIVESNEDYYILSLKTLKSSGYYVITILKVNQSGELIWEKDYGTLGNDEVGYFSPSSTDDEIIIYGARQHNFYSASGSSWGMIYAIDTSGTVIWEHEDEPIGNQQYEPYEYVIRDDEGGWVVSQPKIHRPVKNSESTWSEQSRIRKLDDDFNVVWSLNLENYLGYDLYKNITAISTLESSDIIISGNTPTAVFPGVDGLSVSELAKINSGGNLKWMRYDTLFYGLDKSVLIENNKHIILPSGSIMLCGTITTNSGEYYGFIEKLDKDGCLMPGCRDTSSTEDLSDSKEVQLYPNPATHEIQISGSIADIARLRIYDQLGRSYADVMLDGDRRLNVSSWPDGVYIYSITPREGGEKIEGKLI